MGGRVAERGREPLLVYLRPVGMASAWAANPHVPTTAADLLQVLDDCYRADEGPICGAHVHVMAPVTSGAGPSWSSDPADYVAFSEVLARRYPGLPFDLDLNPLPEPQREPTFLASAATFRSLWPSRMRGPGAAGQMAAFCQSVQGAGRRLLIRVLGPEDLDAVVDAVIRPGMVAGTAIVVLTPPRRDSPLSARNYREVRAAMPPGALLFVQLTTPTALEAARLVIACGDHIVTGLSEIDGTGPTPVANQHLVHQITQLARSTGRPVARPQAARELLLHGARVPATAPGG